MRLVSWQTKSHKPFTTRHDRDLPDTLEPRVLYLLGKPGNEWLAGLTCPCGCREIIELPLKGSSPKWSVKVSNKGISTISPSVFRSVGCKSHFWLKSGFIRWV